MILSASCRGCGSTVPRACTICSHYQCPAIDTALVAGESFRIVAARFGTSTAALQRHRLGHIPGHVAQAHEAEAVAGADDLLDQVRSLQRKALALLAKAERQGDFRTALAGVKEARSCLELLLEVEGELDRRNVVNILVAPQWIEIRAVLVETLQPYPEAAQAVAGRLQVIEGGASHAIG